MSKIHIVSLMNEENENSDPIVDSSIIEVPDNISVVDDVEYDTEHEDEVDWDLKISDDEKQETNEKTSPNNRLLKKGTIELNQKFQEQLDTAISHIAEILKDKLISRKCSCCQRNLYSGSLCLQCNQYMHTVCLEQDHNEHIENKEINHGNCIITKKPVKAHYCAKCRNTIRFGIQCIECRKVYHARCLNAMNCLHPSTRVIKRGGYCTRCRNFIKSGVKCLECKKNYHTHCLNATDQCVHYFTVCIKSELNSCHANPKSTNLSFSLVQNIVKEEKTEMYECLKCSQIFHSDCLEQSDRTECDHANTTDIENSDNICSHANCLHDLWNFYLRQLEPFKIEDKKEKVVENSSRSARYQMRQLKSENTDHLELPVTRRKRRSKSVARKTEDNNTADTSTTSINTESDTTISQTLETSKIDDKETSTQDKEEKIFDKQPKPIDEEMDVQASSVDDKETESSQVNKEVIEAESMNDKTDSSQIEDELDLSKINDEQNKSPIDSNQIDDEQNSKQIDDEQNSSQIKNGQESRQIEAELDLNKTIDKLDLSHINDHEPSDVSDGNGKSIEKINVTSMLEELSISVQNDKVVVEDEKDDTDISIKHLSAVIEDFNKTISNEKGMKDTNNKKDQDEEIVMEVDASNDKNDKKTAKEDVSSYNEIVEAEKDEVGILNSSNDVVVMKDDVDMKDNRKDDVVMKEARKDDVVMKEAGKDDVDMKDDRTDDVVMKEAGKDDVDMKEAGKDDVDMKDGRKDDVIMKEAGKDDCSDDIAMVDEAEKDSGKEDCSNNVVLVDEATAKEDSGVVDKFDCIKDSAIEESTKEQKLAEETSKKDEDLPGCSKDIDEKTNNSTKDEIINCNDITKEESTKQLSGSSKEAETTNSTNQDDISEKPGSSKDIPEEIEVICLSDDDDLPEGTDFENMIDNNILQKSPIINSIKESTAGSGKQIIITRVKSIKSLPEPNIDLNPLSIESQEPSSPPEPVEPSSPPEPVESSPVQIRIVDISSIMNSSVDEPKEKEDTKEIISEKNSGDINIHFLKNKLKCKMLEPKLAIKVEPTPKILSLPCQKPEVAVKPKNKNNKFEDLLYPKIVMTTGAHIPTILQKSRTNQKKVQEEVMATLCAKCHHAPANPVECPGCFQTFHPGCMSSPSSSNKCNHLQPTKVVKKDPYTSDPICQFCLKRVIMFLRCKFCEQIFHASCMRRSLKNQDPNTCIHRPDCATTCTVCSLYMENPIICSKCSTFYHQECFNELVPEPNKCQHTLAYKLFDDEQQEEELSNTSPNKSKKLTSPVQSSTPISSKRNALRMTQARTGASMLSHGDQGLKRVFDFMLCNNDLPLRSVDAYLTSFKELEINIAKCPEYQKRACVKLLTEYINKWPLWKKEVHSEYELYLQMKENYRVKRENSKVVMDEWKNTLEHQIYLKDKRAWYNKFFSYLKDKFVHIMPLLSVAEPTDFQNGGADTGTTPYAVCVEGPPRNLNSIVFTLEGKDVTLKQHSDKPFNATRLTYKQFINHPYVTVRLQLADIDLKRSNVHEYDRFIMKGGVNIDLADPELIYSVKKVNPDAPVEVFTYLYFSKYFQQLEEMMSKNAEILIPRREEIKVLLNEFLIDLTELKMKNNMATNTSVCFGIGCNKYIRSKQTTMKDINFWEVLTPKVDITLRRFTPQQDCHSRKISFRTLNKYSVLTASFAKEINTICIVYECNLCTKTFQNYNNINAHFMDVHREENAVICWKCGESVEIHELTNNRWRHGCTN